MMEVPGDARQDLAVEEAGLGGGRGRVVWDGEDALEDVLELGEVATVDVATRLDSDG
jgi:hypothetical protein